MAFESLREQYSVTREEWLEKAVEKIRPYFLHHKFDIPPVAVSCGFPSKSPLKTLGECWPSSATFDGTRQIFITPTLGKEKVDEVLGTLVHELLHSCLPDDEKHGPKFKDGMKVLGLEGPARNAGPGKDLQIRLDAIAEELGEYPNHRLTPKEKTKKEKALAKKSFKVHCPKLRNTEKSCRLVEVMTGGDYTVTASRKSLKFGFPLCPGCSSEMEMESEDFELYKLGTND